MYAGASFVALLARRLAHDDPVATLIGVLLVLVALVIIRAHSSGLAVFDAATAGIRPLVPALIAEPVCGGLVALVRQITVPPAAGRRSQAK